MENGRSGHTLGGQSGGMSIALLQSARILPPTQRHTQVA